MANDDDDIPEGFAKISEVKLSGAKARRFMEAMQRAQQDLEPNNPPLLQAQAMELRMRWRNLHNLDGRFVTPQPGDLCVEKPGLGYINDDARPHTLFLLVRPLDMSLESDKLMVLNVGRRLNINAPNCVVAEVEGAGIMYMPHNTAELMVWKPDEGQE